QGVKLLVTVAALFRRVRQFPFRSEVSIKGENVEALIESGVAHQVAYRAMANKTRSVKVAPLSYADQIRYARGIKDARSLSRADAGRDRLKRRCDFLKGHLIRLSIWVFLQPRRGIVPAHKESKLIEYFILIFSLRRFYACFVSKRAIIGETALRPFDYAFVRHHATMTHGARENPQLYPALLSHDVSHEGKNSIPGYRHPILAEPGAPPYL